jgi:formylglycine-generating enzyme required for sulfatase activity
LKDETGNSTTCITAVKGYRLSTYPIDNGKGTHEVGTKAVNESDIHDMTGNVFEWCQDGLIE